ncbi:PEPxxWA-CTERM sorting domain-containing protein [uncultured Rhodoblastus sp.]|uniref:PEPxxWA-CTERM sorting domain-containing protein n=1 Tax=uncultured Rhodoblastus sp. TaxID=543037 RepID=UPI0025CE020E|nr:PEPxxWA-CTERM sorting domain-containing protein [uncultured Rhodoblastus sp.]
MTKRISTVALAALIAGGALVAATTAYASSVTVIYSTITTANPDAGGAITGLVTGLVKSTLGPDGLPVEAVAGTFSNVNGAGELLWWTPDGVNVTAGVSYAYPNPAALPFDIQKNFFPNGTGGSNAGGYTSAILSGTFNTPAGGSVIFKLGSDDDAWIFLNGNLVVDNGGIHALVTAPTTVAGLAPGLNTVKVFFADRHVVQSGLYFDANVTVNPSVPEPSTWAMMLLGFAGLGFAGYRGGNRRRNAVEA